MQDAETVDRVLQKLKERNDWTDEQLSEELGMRPSHVRQCLYALYDLGVARYNRGIIKKPDGQKWISFLWYWRPVALGPKADLVRA